MVSGIDLSRVFAFHIAKRLEVRTPFEFVIVDNHFAVERDDVARRSDDKRVDLRERTACRHKGRIQLLHDFRRCARQLGDLVQEKAELERFERHQAVPHVHRVIANLFGSRRGDFLDVDTACRTDHEHRLLPRAVDDDADIRFAHDIGGRGDEHLRDGQPFDRHPENVRGLLVRFVGGCAELHAAGLPSPADMNLRLHHHGSAELRRCFASRFRGRDDFALRRGHAKPAQDVLGLVFVEIHGLCVRV